MGVSINETTPQFTINWGILHLWNRDHCPPLEILDARILRLQHRRSLRCAAFVGNAGAGT